jgi:hypothetical protein
VVEVKDWRNMPGPGDPETWGPCRNHPNDPRTPDISERFEQVEQQIIERRMSDWQWFQEAIAEANEEQIKSIMALVTSKGDDNLGGTIYGIVADYVRPNDWEVGEQIELEDSDDE